MCLLKNVIIFSIFVVYCYLYWTREESIDHHDRKNSANQNEYLDDHDRRNSETQYSQDKHFRDILRIILDAVYFNKNSNRYEGRLNIELNKGDYDILAKIQAGQELYSIKQFEQVLKNSLHVDDDLLLSILERFQQCLLLYMDKILLCIGLILLYIFLWTVKPKNFSFSMLFKLFLPLAYLADFTLRYFALLEEVEVDHFIKISNYEKCDPKKMGWIAWSWDKLTNDCMKNDREMFLAKRPAIHIMTPLKVIAQQFEVMVVIFKYIGGGFGQLTYALVAEGPWYLKPFMAILALFIAFIFLIFGCHILGASIKIYLTPLFKFEFLQKGQIKHSEKEVEGDSLSGENLKLLLKSKTRSNNTIYVNGNIGNTPRFRVKNLKGPKKCGKTWRKASNNRAGRGIEKNRVHSDKVKENPQEARNSWSNWGGDDQTSTNQNLPNNQEKFMKRPGFLEID